MNKTWKFIGALTLYTLIGFGLSSLAVFAYSGQWWWFATIAGCFLCVITAEIASYIVSKKTISKRYGEWIKQGGSKAFMAYLGLIFFSLAMVSLVLHLVAYGLR